ncbi:MAG: hypothetical protein OXT67_09715 [Zetaproteobacteria bacterium]|nr:hypothetical protein [Zetaproteobacteria bacterium]
MKVINDITSKYADKGVSLSFSILEDELVLIQGSKVSLEFLGNLLLTLASSSDESSVQLSPRGAGKHFFDDQSKLGLYLNKVEPT